MAKRSRKKKEQPAAESLPDDLLVEVLARVPYRSICRFKCVSKPWLALCSDPGLRKRSPQALSGFFCYDRDDDWKHELRFLNLSGRGQPLVDPGLPFLRDAWEGGVQTVDCCGGLLLCECWKRAGSAGVEYVVCNPPTEEWTVVPATEELHPDKKNIIRLGFDPLVPSHFAVFVLVRGHDGRITGVEIFSSETGRWISKQSEWGDRTSVDDHCCSVSVFFGGALHLTTHDSSVITVDMEGNAWRKIRMPLSMADTLYYGYIGQSQGRLYAMHMDYRNDNCQQLSVWVLEDYASGQWTLKHTADMSEMVGHNDVCTLVAVDMECKSIFFHVFAWNEKLVSYDMENQRSRVIFSFERDFNLRCDPYIPSYTEWLSDGLLKAAP